MNTEKKPFWQSKIVAFCSVLFIWSMNQLSILSEVTPEMIKAAEVLGGETVEAIKGIKSGGQVFANVVALVSPVIVVIRVWFTNKKLV